MSMAKRSMSGFTLLELLVTMALFATLATIAIPNFSSIIQENRVITVANDYKTALSYARSEAVKRNQSVSLLPSSSGWDAGWEVASQADSLRTWSQPRGDITLTGAPDRFTFNSQGRLVTTGFTSWEVSIALDNRGRCVRIEPSGISRVLSSRQVCQ
ncbi:GspH/FimT family pseudopilin [Vreelandella olivaria]|uniref:GspH/FimT family pseudopilin n=1 Tax=Vreelandella olivaria TaxID=390919 RepID=UPI00201E75BC|nr:GspH/FimT family pseudopilin [Halomonas olivaria]